MQHYGHFVLFCADFDHHQTGVLQERLNSDTEKLASTIIQQVLTLPHPRSRNAFVRTVF
jgi:hypothetical protein